MYAFTFFTCFFKIFCFFFCSEFLHMIIQNVLFFVFLVLCFFGANTSRASQELDKTKLWDNTKTTGLEKPENFEACMEVPK